MHAAYQALRYPEQALLLEELIPIAELHLIRPQAEPRPTSHRLEADPELADACLLEDKVAPKEQRVATADVSPQAQAGVLHSS